MDIKNKKCISKIRNAGKFAALAISAATLFSAAVPAMAQNFEGPYSCQRLEQDVPDPSDSFGALTQGRSGYFFRTDPDLNWGFFLANEAQQQIRSLNDALRSRGTTLVLLPVPPRGLVAQNFVELNSDRSPVLSVSEGAWMYDTYIRDLRGSGAIVPNIMEALRTQPNEAPLFYFKRDMNWRPSGARFAAETVAQALRQSASFRGVISQGYQTNAIGDASIKGQMAESIQRLCDQVLPAEIYTEFQTAAMGGLGNTTNTAAIALVGTSFSADKRFNFAGFLSQALGQPVVNYAVANTDEFTSIESFLASPAYHRNPPSVLVWELPANFDLNRAGMEMNQVVTALQGECRSTAVAQTEMAAGPGSVIELPVTGGQNISASGHYVHINTSNPAMNNFVVSVSYQDGDAEWIPIERSGRFENSGDYYLSLSPEITAPVVKVTVDQLSEVNSTTRVEICRK